MKKITLFIVLSILIFCFIGQSAAMAIPFNQELDYVQVALSSLDKSPTCELLSTSVIESEGDFTCVETVFLEKVPIATMNLNGGNTSRIGFERAQKFVRSSWFYHLSGRGQALLRQPRI